MHLKTKAISVSRIPTRRIGWRPSSPATLRLAAQDLKTVLAKLDTAAANFHSTSADFQFDSYQTDPVPDKDTQKGVVYYERSGNNFQMAAHINEDNGKSIPSRFTSTPKASFSSTKRFPIR